MEVLGGEGRVDRWSEKGAGENNELIVRCAFSCTSSAHVFTQLLARHTFACGYTRADPLGMGKQCSERK